MGEVGAACAISQYWLRTLTFTIYNTGHSHKNNTLPPSFLPVDRNTVLASRTTVLKIKFEYRRLQTLAGTTGARKWKRGGGEEMVTRLLTLKTPRLGGGICDDSQWISIHGWTLPLFSMKPVSDSLIWSLAKRLPYIQSCLPKLECVLLFVAPAPQEIKIQIPTRSLSPDPWISQCLRVHVTLCLDFVLPIICGILPNKNDLLNQSLGVFLQCSKTVYLYDPKTCWSSLYAS